MTVNDETESTENWKLWAAGLLIGTVVLLGVWLLVATPSDSSASNEPTENAQPNQPVDDPDPETQTGQEQDEGCPNDLPVSEEIPEETPEVRWDLYNTLGIPFSDTHGPFVADDLVASCYARTPTGALIADEQAQARILTSADRNRSLVAMAAPSQGRDTASKSIIDLGDVRKPLPGELCQSIGFRFINYTPTKAIISKSSQCPNGDIQVTESTLLWDDSTNGWLLQVQSDGSISPILTGAINNDEFIGWGGV